MLIQIRWLRQKLADLDQKRINPCSAEQGLLDDFNVWHNSSDRRSKCKQKVTDQTAPLGELLIRDFFPNDIS